MDEAVKRHLAVMLFSTAARHFMRKHRAYWSLVPPPARGKLLIPSPRDQAQTKAQEIAGTN